MKASPTDEIYLVGLPELTHPGGSRYLNSFYNHLAVRYLSPPIRSRYFWSRWGWSVDRWPWYLDQALSRLAGRPGYTRAVLLMELGAALHMISRRGRIYHAVHGEVDLRVLPRVSRITGNYLVATFHRTPRQLAYFGVDRRITDHLAGAILLAETQRSYFESLLPPERIFVVHHGVDTRGAHPPEAPPRDPVCITVGSYFRDAMTLAEAMRRVWRVRPEVRLLAIGTRRPEDPNPTHLDRVLEDERVQFLDGLSEAELLAAYHGSRLAIVCVEEAIANNALLEAMACGLPVVATDVGGIPEYLGEAGVLCPPRDPEALSDAVIGILDDPSAGEALGRAARARARQFDHAVIAERLREVYARIVELGPR